MRQDEHGETAHTRARRTCVVVVCCGGCVIMLCGVMHDVRPPVVMLFVLLLCRCVVLRAASSCVMSR